MFRPLEQGLAHRKCAVKIWLVIVTRILDSFVFILNCFYFNENKYVFIICCYLLDFNMKIEKWAEELNAHFFPKNIHMTSRYMNKCSTSLTIKEEWLKSTMSYHLTPLKMLPSKKQENSCHQKNRYWWGWGEKGTFVHC